MLKFQNHCAPSRSRRRSSLKSPRAPQSSIETLEHRRLLSGSDSWAGATVFTTLPVADGPTSNATFSSETDDPGTGIGTSPNHTAWYKWTAPSSGAVSVDTNGSNFDTTLAVFSGSTLASLSRIVNNDDGIRGTDGLTSRLSFQATSGVTYSIEIDGISSASTGNIFLNINVDQAPTAVINNQPLSVISGGSFQLSGSETDDNPAPLAASKYEWDLDYNGTTFNVTNTGQTPTFSAVGLSPGTRTIAFRVYDQPLNQVSSITTATVTIVEALPSPGVGTDPTDPTKTALVVRGTDGNDTILIDKGNGSSSLKVTLNGTVLGTFAFTGKLLVFGGDGNDTIKLASQINRDAFIYGGGGNDTISSGNGATLVIGGDGNDSVTGGNGRDILIGGNGTDWLNGGNGDDLLIAGSTAYDTFNTANVTALSNLFSEWSRTDLAYSARVNRLLGVTAGSAFVFNTSGGSQNVFDDGAADHLTGDNDNDWFIGNFTGGGVFDLTDHKAGEILTDL